MERKRLSGDRREQCILPDERTAFCCSWVAPAVAELRTSTDALSGFCFGAVQLSRYSFAIHGGVLACACTEHNPDILRASF